MHLIQQSYVSKTSYVENEILNSLAVSLIVKCQYLWINSLTRATVSWICANDGWPVCGLSLIIVQTFLTYKYHWNVLDQLAAVPPNACCSISYISVAI
jgi:hypothetical protein